MTQHTPAAQPNASPKTLAQQKADFTAEGAPPPGQLPPSPPDEAEAVTPPAAPAAAAKG